MGLPARKALPLASSRVLAREVAEANRCMAALVAVTWAELGCTTTCKRGVPNQMAQAASATLGKFLLQAAMRQMLSCRRISVQLISRWLLSQWSGSAFPAQLASFMSPAFAASLQHPQDHCAAIVKRGNPASAPAAPGCRCRRRTAKQHP